MRDPWHLPTATRAVEGRSMTYVRPSRMTHLGWDAGAGWDDPTSLEFSHETIDVQRYAAFTVLPPGPIPPRALVLALEVLWEGLRRGLDEAGHVVDPRDPQGVELALDRDFETGETYPAVRVSLKTWPRVRGVNAPGPYERDPSDRWS